MTNVYKHTTTKTITLYANLKNKKEKTKTKKCVIYLFIPWTSGTLHYQEISSGGTVAYFKQAK